MEGLFSQFNFLSNQSLNHNSFDPEDLTNLFELESYKAWAAVELDNNHEHEKTEQELKETEELLETDMESAMREFYEFEKEMDLEAEREMASLVKMGDGVWQMGKNIEYGARMAANKCIEGAIRSGKSAWKRVNKVHPA